MVTLDHVGDQEVMVHAQLGQQPLAHTTKTSLQPRQGMRSCLSAQPPALADAARTRPRVVAMFLSTVPFVYSKRTAVTRSLFRVLWDTDDRTFCGHYEHTSRGTTPTETSTSISSANML